MSDDLEATCDDVWPTGEWELREDSKGCYGCAFILGAAALGGLIGMALAISENDSVRACGHCGLASPLRIYCDHPMCDPTECFYWICLGCHDKGLRFDRATQCMSADSQEKR